jgi:DNA-directed RNA polymerase specialized sigma24 family protein
VQAMDLLHDRQRAVLILWMQEEKSYEELAQEMKTHVGALKVLLFRAKENLAKIMQEDSK